MEDNYSFDQESLIAVSKSMQYLFEAINALQKYEITQAKRRALRTVELSRRKGIWYEEAYEEALAAERRAIANESFDINYNEASELIEQAGLPSLISPDPRVIEARRIAGISLYSNIAEWAKNKIAQRKS